MRRTLQVTTMTCTLVAALITTPARVHAGLPVIDWASLVQNTISAVEAVNHYSQLVLSYKTQLEQYERMLTDGVVPAIYLWDNIESTINNVSQAGKLLADAKTYRGIAQDAVKKFSDPNYYRGSNCYNTTGAKGGCFEAYRKFLNDQREIEALANDNREDLITSQEKELEQRHERLKQLQTNAQGAQGQLEAAQYGIQFASAQLTALEDLRALILAQQRVAVEAEKRRIARETAEAEISAKLRNGKFEKSPVREW